MSRQDVINKHIANGNINQITDKNNIEHREQGIFTYGDGSSGYLFKKNKNRTESVVDSIIMNWIKKYFLFIFFHCLVRSVLLRVLVSQ